MGRVHELVVRSVDAVLDRALVVESPLEMLNRRAPPLIRLWPEEFGYLHDRRPLGFRQVAEECEYEPIAFFGRV